MERDTTYNGWKNRATWNVALWVSNDEPMYRLARRYVHSCKRRKEPVSWTGFLMYAGLARRYTPDGFPHKSNELCYSELTRMLKEIDS